jgi:hypothetical protein
MRRISSHQKPARAGKPVRNLFDPDRCADKKRFASKVAALLFASRMLKKPFCEKQQFQAYYCPYCHRWHLSDGVR